MSYVLVRVAEMGYRKSDPLTYFSELNLDIGSVVNVPYGKKTVLGFVIEKDVTRPKFKTKSVASVIENVIIPPKTIALETWMHNYYPSGGSITSLFLPSGLSTPKPNKSKVPNKVIKSGKYPELTSEQNKAYKEIRKSKNSVMLHGETGSGKSRLYVEAIKDSIKDKKSALVLVPEISLVPQMQNYLESCFGARVVPIHSGLTKSLRLKNWHKIHSSTGPIIVIGARSAIFSPFRNLGLVVIDEMHEPAYKQDSSPFYNGIRAAARLARIHSAKLIYGSATPTISEYFIAEQTKTPIIRITKLALPSKKTNAVIVDMTKKENLSTYTNLSSLLIDAMKLQLQKNQQTLIFLNRRGTARQILCKSCGWNAQCPNCDITLVYHGDNHLVRCHTCGFKDKPPYSCPVCSQKEITYQSLGTKALSETLQNIFPEARIQRFDTDNLASEKLDRHFASIKAGEIDILVGTQMLGKGLDLPKLGLVGIVNADTGLGMPDFSASERTYQLLHQAMGRVGRGHVDGEVVIQSYNPNNRVIIDAVKRDWGSLYKREIAERKKYVFPPFCYLLKITVSRKSSASAENYISKFYKNISSSGLPIQANLPTPSFYQKSFGRYNWQIIVKSKDRKVLLELIGKLPTGDWNYDIDPINLL